MKNTIKIIVCLLALTIGLSSCDKFTDIKPKGMVLPETVGHYHDLLSSPSMAEAPISYMLASDDVFFPDELISTLQPWVIRTYKWEDYQFNIDEIDIAWQQAFSEVFHCNVVINNIDGAEGEESIKEQAKAEALFHKGYTNFQLVNMYAKAYDASTANTDPGIPLVKDDQILQELSRATVAEVYESILEDIQLSIDRLPETYRADGFTRFSEATKRGAYGVLSRVYLFMGDYDKVIQAGDEFFSTQPYEVSISDMNDPFFFVFNFASPEHVFLQMPAVQGNFDFIQGISLSDDLLSLFDASKDLRLQFLTYQEDGKTVWADIFSAMPDPGVSTTEVLLNMAEAYARQGNKDKAIELINILQVRRHIASLYTPLVASSLTEEEALIEVLNERRRELMITGKRFFDLKRLNKEQRFQKTIRRTVQGESIIIEPGDNRYQFAIPRDVIAINPKLEQNPR